MKLKNVGSLVCCLAGVFVIDAVWAQGQGVPYVRVESVLDSDLQMSRRYTGLLTSPATVSVTAQVIGEVVKTGFKEGGDVQVGQLLYQIDDVKYAAAVKAAEAKVAQCKANLVYAQKTYDRKKVLFSKNASSAEDVDSATSNLAALGAALNAAEAELIAAQKDLTNTKIVAPIDGRIGKNDVAVGNYVTPSTGPLTTIVQLDPLRLQFAISNRDFLEMFGDEAGLRKNSVIRFKLSDGSWYEQEGEVEFLDNQINRKTDSVWVYVKVKNTENKLLPGATVTVYLSKKSNAKSPAVKISSIMHDANGAYVYVVDDKNVATKRNVTLSFSDGELQILKDGVKAGEKVITEGTHKVANNREVKPIEK